MSDAIRKMYPVDGAFVVGVVSTVLNIPADAIMGRSRFPQISNARQVAMAVMREGGNTFADIGRFFGRDHSTVMYSTGVVSEHTVAKCLAMVAENEPSSGSAGVLATAVRLLEDAWLLTPTPEIRAFLDRVARDEP